MQPGREELIAQAFGAPEDDTEAEAWGNDGYEPNGLRELVHATMGWWEREQDSGLRSGWTPGDAVPRSGGHPRLGDGQAAPRGSGGRRYVGAGFTFDGAFAPAGFVGSDDEPVPSAGTIIGRRSTCGCEGRAAADVLARHFSVGGREHVDALDRIVQRAVLARCVLAPPALDGPIALLSSIMRPAERWPKAGVVYRLHDLKRPHMQVCVGFERALRIRTGGAGKERLITSPTCGLCGLPPDPGVRIDDWLRNHLLAGLWEALRASRAQSGG